MESDQFDDSTQSASGRTRRATVAIGLIAVVLLVVVIGGFVLMIVAGVTDTVRDIFIIFMAVEMILIGLLALALIAQLISLTRTLRDEITPLIQNMQETVNATRGTTKFVSDKVVRPLISVAGTVAGIRRVFSMIGELRRPRRRRS